MFKKNRENREKLESKSLKNFNNDEKKSCNSTTTNIGKKPKTARINRPSSLKETRNNTSSFFKKSKVNADKTTTFAPIAPKTTESKTGSESKASSINCQLRSVSSKSGSIVPMLEPRRRAKQQIGKIPRYLKVKKSEVLEIGKQELINKTESQGQLKNVVTKTKPEIVATEADSSQKSVIAEKVLKLNEVKDKVLNAHESGYKLCKEFIEHFEKIRKSAGDTGIEPQFVDSLKLMKEKLQIDEKKQKININDIIKSLEYLKPENDQSRLIFEKEKYQFNINIEAYKTKLKEAESKFKKINETNSKLIKELEAKLNENLLSKTIKDNEIQRIGTINKTLTEHTEAMSTKNDLLSKELNEIEKQLQHQSNENRNLHAKLKKIDKEYGCYESEIELCKSLKKTVEENQNKIENLQAKIAEKNKNEENNSNLNNKRMKELSIVQKKHLKLLEEKRVAEEEKAKLSNYADKEFIGKIKEELNQIKSSNKSLKENMKEMEDVINDKTTIILELEEQINDVSSQYQKKIDSLENTEILDSEIFQLKIENTQLTATNSAYFKLLENRKQLINFLPDVQNRFQLTDLYPDDRNHISLPRELYINNPLININAPDLVKIATSLDVKAIELERRSFIIKVLEEYEETNKKRIKQLEEKNKKLETQLLEMKRVTKLLV